MLKFKNYPKKLRKILDIENKERKINTLRNKENTKSCTTKIPYIEDSNKYRIYKFQIYYENTKKPNLRNLYKKKIKKKSEYIPLPNGQRCIQKLIFFLQYFHTNMSNNSKNFQLKKNPS